MLLIGTWVSVPWWDYSSCTINTRTRLFTDITTFTGTYDGWAVIFNKAWHDEVSSTCCTSTVFMHGMVTCYKTFLVVAEMCSCRLAISSTPADFLQVFFQVARWPPMYYTSDTLAIHPHTKSIRANEDPQCTVFFFHTLQFLPSL